MPADLTLPASAAMVSDTAAFDTVRVFHLMSVSAAFGLVAFLNYSLMLRWFRPVQFAWVTFQIRAQEFVVGAAVFAWLTGNLMIWLLYDLRWDLLPDALMVKLSMLAVLVVSALYSRLRLAPTLRAGAGLTIAEFDRRARRTVAIASGLSITCWLSLFLLGASRMLREGSMALAIETVLLIAVVCIGGCVLAVGMGGRRRGRAPMH